jgi:TonB-linked SusC/RagA family outer membrane protein
MSGNFIHLLKTVLLVLFGLPANLLMAQINPVNGTVHDEHGDPLTGVNIVIKGASTGTVTDIDGNYSVNTTGNAVLVFSYIGFTTQEVQVRNQKVINVVMKEDTKIIDEVVVIGYGSRSKKDITTSISVLSSEKVNKVVAMSPEMAMQGQMSGIQVSGNLGDPNSRPTLRIRGTNTWAVSDPLYVIDGIPIKEYGAGIEGSETTNNYGRGRINIMSMINPSDIESISVLKDAASAAIYGVRAANGVVLITTKKGRRERPVVEFTQRIGVQNQNKRVDIFNTKDYADYVYNFYKTDPYDPDAMHNDGNPQFDPASPLYLGDSPTYDWQEATLNKNALTRDYSVRLSGGSEKSDYMASFGYSNEEGVRVGSNLNRYSGSIKLNVDINRYIRTGVNVRISYGSGTSAVSPTIIDAAATPPWQPVYDPDGIAGYASVIYGRMADGSWNTTRKYSTFMTRNNFLGIYATRDDRNESLRMMGNAYLEAEPVAGLKLKGTISLDRFSNNMYNFKENRGNVFDMNGVDPEGEGIPTGSLGEYEERLVHQQNIVWELSANYTKTFNKVHNIDVLVNGMVQRYEHKYMQPFTRYMTTTKRKARSIQDDESTQIKMWQGYGALVGGLLRLSYNYDSKYYIDATLRRDASSRFAPAYRWGTFPGVSGAWRISSEEFMKGLEWMNDLKVRASWGKLGNQEVSANAFLQSIDNRPRYAWGNNPERPGLGSLSTGATVSGMANQRLTWEKTATTNIGFDFAVLNGLTGSFEYYRKLTDGILQDVTLPPSYGVMFYPVDNIASVINRGIELNLNYTHEINDIVFSAGGNLTTVRNRVNRMYEGIPYWNIQEGYSMHYIRGYVLGGIMETQEQVNRQKGKDRLYREDLVAPGDFWFVDLRGKPAEEGTFYTEEPDGVIDEYDQVYLGKTIPGYYYGFNLSAEYKGFDISALFSGVGDVQRTNEKKNNFLNTSKVASNMDPAILNYWRPDNTNTMIPRLRKGDPASNNRFSSYFVENADYLRLSSLQTGYTLPESVYKAMDGVLNYARLYLGASNLFTITKFGGLDPEDERFPAPLIIYGGISLRF